MADRDGLMHLHASDGDSTISISLVANEPGNETAESGWLQARLEAFARWHDQLFLYRPASNRLLPFIPDAHGSWPRRDDDTVLAIHASALDPVARLLCVVE